MSNNRRGVLTKLFNQQAGICPYCGDKMFLDNKNSGKSATIEHLIPKSKGGPSKEFNYMAACYECNQERGNKPLGPFLIRKLKYG